MATLDQLIAMGTDISDLPPYLVDTFYMGKVYTIMGAAKKLNVCRRTIYTMCKEGRLELVHRFNKRGYVTVRSVEREIRRRERKAKNRKTPPKPQAETRRKLAQDNSIEELAEKYLKQGD